MENDSDKQIYVVDQDHIWVDGQQYISLKILAQIKNQHLKEMQLVIDKISEINKIVETYKTSIGN